MNTQMQVLEAVLKKHGKRDNELFSSLENVKEDTLKKELERLNLLDYKQRDSFYWELQTMVEACVAEQGGVDDNERLAEAIVEAWNQKRDPKIDQALALSFLYLTNQKFPNSRKAFVSVCDGDIRSYKAFNNKPKLFLDLLIRFLICLNGKPQQQSLFKQADEVMTLLFEESSNWDYRDSINRLGFKGGKGLIFGKINAYKKQIGVENLVYAEGMSSILKDVISENEESEVLTWIREKLTSSGDTIQKQDTEDEFHVDDLLDDHIPGVHTPKFQAAVQEEASIQSVEVEERALITERAEPQTKEPVVNEPIGNDESQNNSLSHLVQPEMNSTQTKADSNITAILKHALESVQTVLNQALEVSKQEVKQPIQPEQDRLQIAEDEIDRLKVMLEKEKEKVSLAEEKAYVKILSAIGGENANYLLSDLFEESQGHAPSNPHISAGRLINLFSSLSLAIGLEEHSNGYELGSTFSIHKDHLIKNFRIDGPVLSSDEVITVKLLKYGWSINGQVVVQPLVTEIKEEKTDE
ncbi:hypothetical protein [Rossellomorea vietnamensis]|uniref:hypothetical protein n=1 Tax=Rossellomorea vietnamensis TaxID=218284 RepID=UPI00077C6867|nr:hypothetical protein [Rossellomorea vietnamensis]